MSLHAGQKRWGIGQVILTICVLLLVSTCVFPFLNVIAISLSSKSAILRGDVNFVPKETNFLAYEVIFKDNSMIQSLLFTIEITMIYKSMCPRSRVTYYTSASIPLWNSHC